MAVGSEFDRFNEGLCPSDTSLIVTSTSKAPKSASAVVRSLSLSSLLPQHDQAESGLSRRLHCDNNNVGKGKQEVVLSDG